MDRGARPSTRGGDSSVDARRTRRRLDATATSKIEGFDKTFGAVVAFNSIGWKSSNILFNALDALVGDPLISSAFNGAQASDAQAWIRNTTLDAGGSISVTASQAATLTATVGNEGTSDAELDSVLSSGSATTGISGGGVLASNKVNTLAKAFIEYSGAAQGTVNAGGDLTVSATDAAAIDSHANVVQITIMANTAQGLAQYISDLLPNDNDYTTKSGTRDIAKGDARSGRAGRQRARRRRPRATSSRARVPESIDLGADGLHRHEPLDRSDRCSRRSPTSIRTSAT